MPMEQITEKELRDLRAKLHDEFVQSEFNDASRYPNFDFADWLVMRLHEYGYRP